MSRDDAQRRREEALSLERLGALAAITWTYATDQEELSQSVEDHRPGYEFVATITCRRLPATDTPPEAQNCPVRDETSAT